MIRNLQLLLYEHNGGYPVLHSLPTMCFMGPVLSSCLASTLCIVRPTALELSLNRINMLLDLVQDLPEPPKTLLGPKALATYCNCEVLVTFVLDLSLIQIILGLVTCQQ